MIAMAQHEPPQIDLDALQAQINLSMSLTENLVSSWIRPIAKNLAKPSQSSKNPEKELQEYLRRPPRLGVGAPLPESSGVLERENIKLKHKLSGNNKKRRREDAEGKVENPTEDTEENERKGESSVKKARLDPFSIPGKRKKKEDPAPLLKPTGKQSSDVVVGAQLSKMSTENGYLENTSIPEKTGPNPSETAVSKQLEESSSNATPSLTSKKRKKKKKLNVVSQVEEAANSNVADTGTSHHEGKHETQDDPEGEGSDEEWVGFGDTVRFDTPPTEEKSEQKSMDKSTSVISPTTKPTLSLFVYPQVIPGPPLLNLHGPPPSDTEDTASLSHTGLSPTTKKKRRRNKNKKKKNQNTNDQSSTS